MDNKKIKLTAIIVLLIGMVSISLAYFYSEETAENKITMGNITIELNDLTDDGETFPTDGLTGILPGDQVTKIVNVKNVGSHAAWIRVQLVPSFDDTELDEDAVTLTLNLEDWTKGEDNWYYYNEALSPEDTTENLLSKVVFPTTLDNDYAGALFTVDVVAQGIQQANNGTSALTATWE